MDEADYKRKLVAQVNAVPGAWACRIEDRYAPGRLDMIIQLHDRPIVFAEGKIIHGNLFKPTKRQFEEGQKIRAAGLCVLLIGWRQGFMFISPWVEEANYLRCYTLPDATFMATLDEYLRTQIGDDFK